MSNGADRNTPKIASRAARTTTRPRRKSTQSSASLSTPTSRASSIGIRSRSSYTLQPNGLEPAMWPTQPLSGIPSSPTPVPTISRTLAQSPWRSSSAALRARASTLAGMQIEHHETFYEEWKNITNTLFTAVFWSSRTRSPSIRSRTPVGRLPAQTTSSSSLTTTFSRG